MAYEVPNPYVATTHPYPTRYHGGLWTRPVFGFPRMESVQSNFKRDDFNDGNPALRGLGMLFNAENGVFGTARNGGGVFGPSLYGMGLGADCALPSSCQMAQRNASQYFNVSILDGYCDASPDTQNEIYSECNKALVAAAQAQASAPPAASTPITPAQISNLQSMLNSALVAAGYNPIAADGKIGPGTCGAIKWYRTAKGVPTAGVTFDPICATKGSTAPTRRTSGGAAPPPAPVAPPPVAVASASPSAGTLAMIGGGVLAVTLAVVGKKKGWF